jgi:hypothetical protein
MSEEKKLEFYVYGRLPDPEQNERELLALQERLRQKTDIDKYRGSCGKPYKSAGGGYTVIRCLQFLWGLPLCDLVMAYMPAVKASAIRVTSGETTTDSRLGRVTIYVNEGDIVDYIEQEVDVAYGCGYDVDQCLLAAVTKRPARPFSGVTGHTAGLERADFK